MVTNRLGSRNRHEQEAEAGGERRQHALRHRRQRRRQRGREHQENETERIEKPAGQPEIGDFFGRVGEPVRQMPRPIARRRVDEKHRGNDAATVKPIATKALTPHCGRLHPRRASKDNNPPAED